MSRSCTCGRLAYASTSRASLLSPVIRPFAGMYPTWATPVNGSRWCSQVLHTSMSRTSTISSWPRSNVVARIAAGSEFIPLNISS